MKSKVRKSTARSKFKSLNSRTNTMNLAPSYNQRGGRRM